MNMKSMENVNKKMIPQEASIESIGGKYENISLKEQIFRTLIEDKIADSFFHLMEELGFSEEEVLLFKEKFNNLEIVNKEYLLSLPFELRKRSLNFMKRQEKPFDEKIEKFLETIIESGKALGRDLGFHATDKSIVPSQTRVNGVPMEEWAIYGTERDHRDNDNYMAYYSEDYMNVYRTKNPKFMYIITSCRAAKSGHKKDNTQNWGRAPKLDVIEKIDLAEIDRTVDQMYKNEIEKEETQKKAT